MERSMVKMASVNAVQHSGSRIVYVKLEDLHLSSRSRRKHRRVMQQTGAVPMHCVGKESHRYHERGAELARAVR